MSKYILKARAGIESTHEQELDWSDTDYIKFSAGDTDLEAEARGIAHELVDLEYWIEVKN